MAEPVVVIELCLRGVRRLRLDHARGDREAGLSLYARAIPGVLDLDRLIRAGTEATEDAALREDVRLRTAQSLAIFDAMAERAAR